MVDAVRAAREKVVEAAADADESLVERYLEGQEISEKEICAAVRQATLKMKVVPVVCGSAFKNKGVQPLLDSVVAYLPSPVDVPAIKATIQLAARPARERRTTRLHFRPWRSRS